MKRRSAAKSRGEPPEPIHLFLDEQLAGSVILEGLRTQGIPADSVNRLVPRGASDPDVLDAVSKQARGFLLTRDGDFRYHRSTHERVITSGIGVFVLTSAGNKNAEQIIAIVTSAWHKMQRHIDRTPRPFVAKITTSGSVEPA